LNKNRSKISNFFRSTTARRVELLRTQRPTIERIRMAPLTSFDLVNQTHRSRALRVK
jgi:hypothetical protein